MTPNEYAADMEDALAKAAGYYATPDVDPDEDMPTVTGQHPLSKLLVSQKEAARLRLHAARPGHMPNVQDLVAENATLRGLLKALVTAYATIDDLCAYCEQGEDDFLLFDVEAHAADCPWRLAKEYLAEREAKGE